VLKLPVGMHPPPPPPSLPKQTDLKDNTWKTQPGYMSICQKRTLHRD
jgi:hypothetical protein